MGTTAHLGTHRRPAARRRLCIVAGLEDGRAELSDGHLEALRLAQASRPALRNTSLPSVQLDRPTKMAAADPIGCLAKPIDELILHDEISGRTVHPAPPHGG